MNNSSMTTVKKAEGTSSMRTKESTSLKLFLSAVWPSSKIALGWGSEMIYGSASSNASNLPKATFSPF